MRYCIVSDYEVFQEVQRLYSNSKNHPILGQILEAKIYLVTKELRDNCDVYRAMEALKSSIHEL